MKLTLNWLIANATETSFERGEEYQDAVSKLQKQGNKYTATVRGTEKYKVEVVETADDIYTHCTCPYHGIGGQDSTKKISQLSFGLCFRKHADIPYPTSNLLIFFPKIIVS